MRISIDRIEGAMKQVCAGILLMIFISGDMGGAAKVARKHSTIARTPRTAVAEDASHHMSRELVEALCSQEKTSLTSLFTLLMTQDVPLQTTAQGEEVAIFEAIKAHNLEMIRALIAGGASLGYVEFYKMGALHYAVDQSELKALATLCNEVGFDALTALTAEKDSEGRNLVEKISATGNLAALKIVLGRLGEEPVLQCIDVTSPKNAVRLAVQGGYIDMVKYLHKLLKKENFLRALNAVDEESTALSGCAATPARGLLKFLVRIIGEKNLLQEMVLRHAENNLDHDSLSVAIRSGNEHFIRELCEELGPQVLLEIETVDIAAHAGQSDMLRLLKELLGPEKYNMAATSQKQNPGLTFLHEVNDPQVIKTLHDTLAQEVFLKLARWEGPPVIYGEYIERLVPLWLAALRGQEAVVQAYAEVLSPEIFKELVAKVHNRKGGNMLLHVARAGHSQVLKVLRNVLKEEFTSCAQRTDAKGRTLLHQAVKGGHLGVFKELRTLLPSVHFKKMLQAEGEGGWTCLHLAASYGRAEILEYLYGYDRDWFKRTLNISVGDPKRTPQQLAQDKNHEDIVAYLESIIKGNSLPERLLHAVEEMNYAEVKALVLEHHFCADDIRAAIALDQAGANPGILCMLSLKLAEVLKDFAP